MKKFLTSSLFLLLLGFSPSIALAQSSIEDPLNSIKGRLEEDDIAVIDYGAEQREWGAIPGEWAKIISEEGYETLTELAEEYEEEFEGEEGLNRKRYELGLLEAQKTRAGTAEERNGLEMEIQNKRREIGGIEGEEGLEEQIKEDIRQALDIKKIQEKDSEEQKDEREIINLIFKEIDFYYSQVRWGNLPYPLSVKLRQESGLWENADEGQKKSIRTLESLFSEVEELESLLSSMEENSTPLFSPTEIDLIVEEVIASRYEGERQVNQVIRTVIVFARNIIASLAILWIVVTGIRMATTSDQGTIDEQKRGILYTVIGLAAILLTERLVSLLYGTPGSPQETLAPSTEFNAEVYGIVSFIRAIVGMIAIFFIIKAGFMSILVQGDEDKISENRKSIIYILVGIVIIAINRLVIENIFINPVRQDDQIYSSNIANIINLTGDVLRFVLGFVGLIALAALVYGGASMVMHYGNDEMQENAKKTIKHAITGIIVIIAAYTIVASLVVFR